jgi:hypothetical protein
VKNTSKPLLGEIAMVISGVLGTLGILSYWIGIGEVGSGLGKGIPAIILIALSRDEFS